MLSNEVVAAPCPAATPVAAERGGVVAIWAAIGLVWVIIAGQAVVRWTLSPGQFTPAPVRGPDHYPLWCEVSLRVREGVSLAVLLGFVWYCVIRPWRRDRTLLLDGPSSPDCSVRWPTGRPDVYLFLHRRGHCQAPFDRKH